MKILLAGTGAVALFLGLIVHATGLVIVDVRQGGPEGKHLIVAVPLALAGAALFFVDSEQVRLQCPQFAAHRDAALRLARELQFVPDARLVEVEERERHITVDKSGDLFEVDVRDGDNEVFVRVPVTAIERLLESHDGEGFAPQDLLAAVRTLPSGECVRVRHGDDHVRVWFW
jgi:hypothetical protein